MNAGVVVGAMLVLTIQWMARRIRDWRSQRTIRQWSGRAGWFKWYYHPEDDAVFLVYWGDRAYCKPLKGFNREELPFPPKVWLVEIINRGGGVQWILCGAKPKWQIARRTVNKTGEIEVVLRANDWMATSDNPVLAGCDPRKVIASILQFAKKEADEQS